MKPFTQSRLVLVLLAGLVAGLGMQGSAAAQREDHKGSATAHGASPDVTLMLASTYRLRSDDADLQLQITSSGGTERSGTLMATLSGKYQGKPMDQRGILHVNNQAPQVLLTVTPQFPEGPESTAKSPHQLGHRDPGRLRDLSQPLRRRLDRHHPGPRRLREGPCPEPS